VYCLSVGIRSDDEWDVSVCEAVRAWVSIQQAFIYFLAHFEYK